MAGTARTLNVKQAKAPWEGVVYQWGPGPAPRVSAEVVGPVLMALHEKHGGLAPELVVKDAKRANHPLHNEFDWDDAVAGQKWRIEQARKIIQKLQVIWPDEPKRPPTHAFFSVVPAEDSPRKYVSIERVMTEPTLFDQAKEQALRELAQFERRYAQFDLIAGIIRAAREQLALA